MSWKKGTIWENLHKNDIPNEVSSLWIMHFCRQNSRPLFVESEQTLANGQIRGGWWSRDRMTFPGSVWCLIPPLAFLAACSNLLTTQQQGSRKDPPKASRLSPRSEEEWCKECCLPSQHSNLSSGLT